MISQPIENPENASDQGCSVLVPSFANEIETPGTFGNHLDFWTPKPIGHHETDYARGVELAREAMECANAYGNAAAILFPLIEMATRGNPTSLEIGFMTRIADAARCGARN